MRYLAFCVALFLTSLASVASAAWSVTTSDFAEISGDLKIMSGQGITLQREGQAPIDIPWDRIVQLRQLDPVVPNAPEPFILYLRDGQRLTGRPTALTDEKLTWRNPIFGPGTFALQNIRGWARADVPLPDSDGKEDMVILANRDELRGVVDAADSGIKLQQGANTASVAWDNIRAVTLADVGGSQPAPSRLRLRCTDGSVYLAQQAQSRAGKLELFSVLRQEAAIPLQSVLSIENHAGKVTFLSWLQPAELQYTPYVSFAPAQKPTGMRILEDQRIGEHSYANVVELRPRSALKYTSPADGMFHLRYAAGAAGELTDMAVRIAIGPKVLQEYPSVRSPIPSGPIEVAMNKGDTVTIEVDYGANFDAQDFLWLLEAAFITK
jgi:hypothetical protein